MPMSRLSEEQRAWVEVLATIYARIPWAKMTTSKNPWDIWNHRIRACSNVGTLGKCVSKLANKFGLQHLPEDTVASVALLEPHARKLLNWTYQEHIPVSMLAVTRSKEIKSAVAAKTTQAAKDAKSAGRATATKTARKPSQPKAASAAEPQEGTASCPQQSLTLE